MGNDIITVDMSEFGHRELSEAIELLTLYKNGIFYEDNKLGKGLSVNFNKHSGYVFLSDENYHVYMEKDASLEQWLVCGQCGHEDFESNIERDSEENDTETCPECERNGCLY